MSKHGKTLQARRLAPVATQVLDARRINIAVSDPMMCTIDRVIDVEQVTLTEAVRRLIALGDLVYEVIRVRKAQLVIQDDDGDREVVLL